MPATLKRLLLLTILFAPLEAGATVKHLKIVHWNDLHAQLEPFAIKQQGRTRAVGGFAYLRAVIDSLRRVAAHTDEGCLALDGGDEFQGTLVSTVTRGGAMYELLNSLHPDAVTLGNHEFDYGWKNLDSLVHHVAQFPIISANVLDAGGENLTASYVILNTSGMKVAVIGLTTERLAGYTLPENISGLQIRRYDEVLPTLLHQAKRGSADLIIVLSHVGVQDDSAIAARYPEVNVIVGGHSHTPLFKPMQVGRTIIVQAGSRGRWVGELDLDIDGDSVTSYNGGLIEVDDERIAPDTNAAAAVAKLSRLVDRSFADTIGTLRSDWKASHDYNGNLSTFEATAFREAFNADIGCINHGGLRKSLLAGPVTRKDVYEINPFQNELVRITLRGSTLREAIGFMLAGRASESCEFSGIRCVFDRTRLKVISLSVGDEPLVEGRSYGLVTNQFVAAHLEALFGIDKADVRSEPLGSTDADVVAHTIRRQHEIEGTPAAWLSVRN